MCSEKLLLHWMSKYRTGKVDYRIILSTRFSLSAENGWVHAGRDGRTCLARQNVQARTGTGKQNIFPVQLATKRLATIPG